MTMMLFKKDHVMPTTYPTDIKAEIIRRYEKCEFIKSLSEELHLFKSALYLRCKDSCSIKTLNAKLNLLKRESSADHPNQIRDSDNTYCKVKIYRVYLYVILPFLHPMRYGSVYPRARL